MKQFSLGFQKTTCVPKSSVAKLCELNCNRGTCKLVENQPKCYCPKEFDGEFCEHYRCSGYCKNKGICHIDVLNVDNVDALPPLVCRCQSQWTGERCDIPVSLCHDICHNGATCLAGHSKCICPIGFNGDNCQNCDDLICENNAICRKLVDGKSHCDCPSGYEGRKCGDSICDGYCSGNGKCFIRLGTPQCDCYPGYWGKQCQSDSCSDYCRNDGICSNVNGSKMCKCMHGFTGARCETRINGGDENDFDPCRNIVCENGGVCQKVRNVGVCNCTAQWNGLYCEQQIHNENPCIDYCENNGICKLDDSSYPICICMGDWMGRKCTMPPLCSKGFCGECIHESSINECT